MRAGIDVERGPCHCYYDVIIAPAFAAAAQRLWGISGYDLKRDARGKTPKAIADILYQEIRSGRT